MLKLEVEQVSIVGKIITPCDGCESCKITDRCWIEDNMQLIYSKLQEADGIIFGTPVYFWSVTAQAKALIDRTYVLREKRRLRNKIGGVIVVARRAGTTPAFSVFLNFFNIHRMVSLGGAIAYGDEKGSVKRDSRGMAEAKALGRNMAKTLLKYRQGGLL